MGFLHHARYFTYFEIGRMELFRVSGGDYRQMEDSGQFVVVVKAECRFRQPARFDDLLTIRTTLRKMTAAKIEHEYIVLRDDVELAQAVITLAVVDRDGKAQLVPQWLHDIY